MHNINDRGMVKWAPFDSLMSSKKICYDILEEKSYQIMPILSDDELNEIENIILECFYNKEFIEIIYYYNGKFYKKTNKIKYIDKYKRQLILKDDFILYFKQIIKVKIK